MGSSDLLSWLLYIKYEKNFKVALGRNFFGYSIFIYTQRITIIFSGLNYDLENMIKRLLKSKWLLYLKKMVQADSNRLDSLVDLCGLYNKFS